MLIPPHNWGLVERGLSRSGLPTSLNLEFLAKQKIKTIVYLTAPQEEEEEEEEEGRTGRRSKLDPALLTFLSEQRVELIQLGGVVTDSDASTDTGSSGGGGGKDGGSGGVGGKSTTSGPTSAIHHHHLHHHLSGWKPTSEELVLSALGHVLDPKLYPLHLMCSSSGRHLTGVVVGCFRKLQRWSLSSIFAEYRRYAGGASNTRGAEDSGGGGELVRNEQFIELFDVELLQATIGQRALAKHMKQLNIAVPPAAQQAAAQAQAALQAQAAAIAAAQAQAAAASSNAAVAAAAAANSTPAERKPQQQQQQAPLSSRASTPSASAAPFASATAAPAASPASAAPAPAPSPPSQQRIPHAAGSAVTAAIPAASAMPAAAPAPAAAAAAPPKAEPVAAVAVSPAAPTAALSTVVPAPVVNAHVGAPPSTSAR